MNDDACVDQWNGCPDETTWQDSSSQYDYLGKIRFTQVLKWEQGCFTSIVQTDRHKLRMTIKVPIDPSLMMQYDPWSVTWNELLPNFVTVVGFEIVTDDARPEDLYGANLSALLRKMALEEKPQSQTEDPKEMARRLAVQSQEPLGHETELHIKRYRTKARQNNMAQWMRQNAIYANQETALMLE